MEEHDCISLKKNGIAKDENNRDVANVVDATRRADEMRCVADKMENRL